MRTRAIAWAVALLAASPAWAQQAPVFKSGTEVVALDVTVVDANGRPIQGLEAQDFVVSVEGAPRTVRSAQYVSRGAAAEPRTRLASSGHYSSNEWATAERAIVLVIDQGSLVAGGPRAILKGAGDFVDRLNPADRVALVTLPGGGPAVEFTTDRKKLKDGLGKVRGQGQAVNESAATGYLEGQEQVQCTTVAGLQHCSNKPVEGAQMNLNEVRQTAANTTLYLEKLLLRLSSMPGQKTVVLFSEGFVSGSQKDPTALVDTESLRTAAAMAGASVYVLHLQQRTGPSNSDEGARRLGLDVVAKHTGGAVFPVTANGEAAFSRIALETSGYYLLGVTPTPEDRDAKAHALKVVVKRDGATVRARGALLLAPTPPTQRSVDDDLLEMLKTPGSKGLLPVSVGTYAYEDSAGTRLLLIAASFDRAVTGPAAYSIGYLVLDGAGRIVASAVDEPKLAVVGSGSYARHQYTTAAQPPPGTYILRLAAIDGQGRRGMVEHRFTLAGPAAEAQAPVDLLLFDGPRVTGSAPTPLPDGLVVGNRLGAHVKLAGGALPAGTKVTVSIAKDEASAALVTVDGAITTEAGSGHALVDATLALADLAADEYVARAAIAIPGRAPVTLVRPFRRVVMP